MSSIRRIRIALDHSRPNPATLEWTAHLARQLQAQIDARFIEDMELFRVAELPFSHYGGGQAGTESLDRQMRQLAQQLEQQLRQLAQREELALQFSRVRGDLLQEVRRAAEDVGLLVLEGFQPTRVRLAAPAFARPGDSWVFLFDGSQAAAQALQLMLNSLPTDGLQVLIQVEDRAQVAAQAEQVTALAQAAGVTALHAGFLPLHDGEHLLHLAQLQHPAAIFLAANNPLLADHPLRELISALPCPLVIVGSLD